MRPVTIYRVLNTSQSFITRHVGYAERPWLYPFPGTISGEMRNDRSTIPARLIPGFHGHTGVIIYNFISSVYQFIKIFAASGRYQVLLYCLHCTHGGASVRCHQTDYPLVMVPRVRDFRAVT